MTFNPYDPPKDTEDATIRRSGKEPLLNRILGMLAVLLPFMSIDFFPTASTRAIGPFLVFALMLGVIYYRVRSN